MLLEDEAEERAMQEEAMLGLRDGHGLHDEPDGSEDEEDGPPEVCPASCMLQCRLEGSAWLMGARDLCACTAMRP